MDMALDVAMQGAKLKLVKKPWHSSVLEREK
jgi:hypothetical protein